MEGVAIVGGDCTLEGMGAHRHIGGGMGLHCAGGRAGTGCDEMPFRLVVKYARMKKLSPGYADQIIVQWNIAAM